MATKEIVALRLACWASFQGSTLKPDSGVYCMLQLIAYCNHFFSSLLVGFLSLERKSLSVVQEIGFPIMQNCFPQGCQMEIRESGKLGSWDFGALGLRSKHRVFKRLGT